MGFKNPISSSSRVSIYHSPPHIKRLIWNTYDQAMAQFKNASWIGGTGLGAILFQHFGEKPKLQQAAFFSKKQADCNYYIDNQMLLVVKMLAFLISSQQAFCF